MCILQSNATADRGFNDIRHSGDKTDYARRLARLAAEDTVAEGKGLERLLQVVLSWWDDEHLRTVRKYTIGRHRAFIVGRHTDCVYKVCYIKVFKKGDVDREEERNFQNKILRALDAPSIREIAVSSQQANGSP